MKTKHDSLISAIKSRGKCTYNDCSDCAYKGKTQLHFIARARECKLIPDMNAAKCSIPDVYAARYGAAVNLFLTKYGECGKFELVEILL